MSLCGKKTKFSCVSPNCRLSKTGLSICFYQQLPLNPCSLGGWGGQVHMVWKNSRDDSDKHHPSPIETLRSKQRHNCLAPLSKLTGPSVKVSILKPRSNQLIVLIWSEWLNWLCMDVWIWLYFKFFSLCENSVNFCTVPTVSAPLGLNSLG